MFRSGRVNQWLRTHKTHLRPGFNLSTTKKNKEAGKKSREGGIDRKRERETGRREKRKCLKSHLDQYHFASLNKYCDSRSANIQRLFSNNYPDNGNFTKWFSVSLRTMLYSQRSVEEGL